MSVKLTPQEKRFVFGILGLVLLGYLLLAVESRWQATAILPLDSLDRAFFLKAHEINSVVATDFRASDAPVNINRAGSGELIRLPGIGPSRAQAILSLRDSLGQFTSIDQIMLVKGIGPATLARMQKQLLLVAPSQEDSTGSNRAREISNGQE